MNALKFASHSDVFCQSDTALPSVFRMMVENHCACVAVVESNAHRNPIGYVSEHTICLRTIVEGLNPRRLRAEDVMNPNVGTIRCDATVEHCLDVLARTAAERLFLIDDDGAYCGTITGADLRLAAARAASTPKPEARRQYVPSNTLDWGIMY